MSNNNHAIVEILWMLDVAKNEERSIVIGRSKLSGGIFLGLSHICSGCNGFVWDCGHKISSCLDYVRVTQ